MKLVTWIGDVELTRRDVGQVGLTCRDVGKKRNGFGSPRLPLLMLALELLRSHLLPYLRGLRHDRIRRHPGPRGSAHAAHVGPAGACCKSLLLCLDLPQLLQLLRRQIRREVSLPITRILPW